MLVSVIKCMSVIEQPRWENKSLLREWECTPQWVCIFGHVKICTPGAKFCAGSVLNIHDIIFKTLAHDFLNDMPVHCYIFSSSVLTGSATSNVLYLWFCLCLLYFLCCPTPIALLLSFFNTILNKSEVLHWANDPQTFVVHPGNAMQITCRQICVFFVCTCICLHYLSKAFVKVTINIIFSDILRLNFCELTLVCYSMLLVKQLASLQTTDS